MSSVPPWAKEPDRKFWIHKGIPCLILRLPRSGALAGYAGVENGHPLYGKTEGLEEVPARGGVDYTGFLEVDEIPGLWWIGFAWHEGDLLPKVSTPTIGAVYRDMAFTTEKVEELADYLIALEKDHVQSEPPPEAAPEENHG